MSDAARNLNKPQAKPLPPPPDPNIEADRTELAQERWTQCPLTYCKRNHHRLYEDYYVRDVRTDRLMCSACTVRTEVGYMAQEVAREHDKRFAGNILDEFLVFIILLMVSAIANVMLIPLRLPYLGLLVGVVAGLFAAYIGKQMVTGRFGRWLPLIAISGVVAGAMLPFTLSMFRGGLRPGMILCTITMIFIVYSSFTRRI